MERCNGPWSVAVELGGNRRRGGMSIVSNTTVRPHEALGMQTPASRWQPSKRRYQVHPLRWEYPAGAWVRKVDGSGKVKLDGRNWNISQALAGDWVQLIQLEERVQVYYCNTLIRELDLALQRSTIVERWSARDVP